MSLKSMAKEEERGGERVITVEYLEPGMASHLLHKFPDNSAFDFDYSQSSIWSPLLPRFSSIAVAKKKKKKPSIREKTLSKLKSKIQKKSSKRKLEFVAGSSPSPAPKKVWNKVVNAAAGCFARGRTKAIKFKELN